MASSQYEKDKLAKKSAADVKKIQIEHTPIPEILTDGPIVPKTFREKWDNFWYHYKMHVIAGIIVFALLLSMVLSFVLQTRYDASLTILSEVSFDGAFDLINQDIGKVLVDYDDNGESLLRINPIQMAKPGSNVQVDPRSAMANQAKLMGILSDRQSYLYMLEDYSYGELKELGVEFLDLTTLSSSERIDGDKYSLKDSKFSELIQLNQMMDDMYLCLIDIKVFDKIKEKQQKAYDNEVNFLNKIIEYN